MSQPYPLCHSPEKTTGRRKNEIRSWSGKEAPLLFWHVLCFVKGNNLIKETDDQRTGG